MADTSDRAVIALAEAGALAHETGVLPAALDELAGRLDDAGAQHLVDAWAAKRIREWRHRLDHPDGSS